jgi:2-oxoglutarate/2-oxoacid ferredoxin oxidoreductase subunit alpha
VEFATEPNHDDDGDADGVLALPARPETLARPWAIPGTPGLEHRIGGIEKADGTGNISYDPDNHDRMVRLRQAKVDGIAVIPPLEVDDPSATPTCSCSAGARPTGRSAPPADGSARRAAGRPGHLRHLNPFPANLGEVLRATTGARPGDEPRPARLLLRARYLVDAIGYNQVRGLPFKAAELADAITDHRGRDRPRVDPDSWSHELRRPGSPRVTGPRLTDDR